MSADGYMVCAAWFDGRVNAGDAQILHLNEPCAVLYHRRAREMVGTFLSLYQDAEFREVGRRNYTLAQCGEPAYQQCATVVRAPNNEALGQNRELVWRLADMHGRETYMVRVSPVQQLDGPVLPDLQRHGITRTQHHAICGRYTVAQLIAFFHNGTLAQRCGKKVTTIVRECSTLAKTFFAGSAEDGILLALNRSRTNWTACETSAALQLAATCPRCGWQWWRKALPGETARCPSCHARLDLATALGA